MLYGKRGMGGNPKDPFRLIHVPYQLISVLGHKNTDPTQPGNLEGVIGQKANLAKTDLKSMR